MNDTDYEYGYNHGHFPRDLAAPSSPPRVAVCPSAVIVLGALENKAARLWDLMDTANGAVTTTPTGGGSPATVQTCYMVTTSEDVIPCDAILIKGSVSGVYIFHATRNNIFSIRIVRQCQQAQRHMYMLAVNVIARLLIESGPTIRLHPKHTLINP